MSTFSRFRRHRSELLDHSTSHLSGQDLDSFFPIIKALGPLRAQLSSNVTVTVHRQFDHGRNSVKSNGNRFSNPAIVNLKYSFKCSLCTANSARRCNGKGSTPITAATSTKGEGQEEVISQPKVRQHDPKHYQVPWSRLGRGDVKQKHKRQKNRA